MSSCSRRSAETGLGAGSRRSVVLSELPQFVIIGALVVTLWLVANGLAFVTFDRKPFILLYLIFSAQAFFAASFILIAQIRQSARDHAVDEAAAFQP
jgi:uncharacterized membrane protein